MRKREIRKKKHKDEEEERQLELKIRLEREKDEKVLVEIKEKELSSEEKMRKALKYSNFRIMIDLIESGEIIPDFEDSYGNTVLIKATLSQDEKAIEKVLDLGVDIDYANKFGETALIVACKKGLSRAVESLLYDKGPFGNARKLQCYPLRANRFGKSAVDYAIESNHVFLAETCLSAITEYSLEAHGDTRGLLLHKIELKKKELLLRARHVKHRIMSEEEKRKAAIIMQRFLRRRMRIKKFRNVVKIYYNDFKVKRQEHKRMQNACIRIQASFRKKLAIKELKKKKFEYKIARKIQSIWRRKLAKRRFKSICDELIEYTYRNEAAIKIQCLFRLNRSIKARLFRVTVWKAATCINKGVRAFLARTMVKRLKQKMHVERERAYVESMREKMFTKFREDAEALQRIYIAIYLKVELRAIMTIQKFFKRILRVNKWKRLCINLKETRIKAAIFFQKVYRGHRGRIRARVFKIKSAFKAKAMQDCLKVIPLIGKTKNIFDMIGNTALYGICVRCMDCSKFQAKGKKGTKIHICKCGHYIRNHVKDLYMPPNKKEPQPMDTQFYINVGYVSQGDLHKSLRIHKKPRSKYEKYQYQTIFSEQLNAEENEKKLMDQIIEKSIVMNKLREVKIKEKISSDILLERENFLAEQREKQIKHSRILEMEAQKIISNEEDMKFKLALYAEQQREEEIEMMKALASQQKELDLKMTLESMQKKHESQKKFLEEQRKLAKLFKEQKVALVQREKLLNANRKIRALATFEAIKLTNARGKENESNQNENSEESDLLVLENKIVNTFPNTDGESNQDFDRNDNISGATIIEKQEFPLSIKVDFFSEEYIHKKPLATLNLDIEEINILHSEIKTDEESNKIGASLMIENIKKEEKVEILEHDLKQIAKESKVETCEDVNKMETEVNLNSVEDEDEKEIKFEVSETLKELNINNNLLTTENELLSIKENLLSNNNKVTDEVTLMPLKPEVNDLKEEKWGSDNNKSDSFENMNNILSIHFSDGKEKEIIGGDNYSNFICDFEVQEAKIIQTETNVNSITALVQNELYLENKIEKLNIEKRIIIQSVIKDDNDPIISDDDTEKANETFLKDKIKDEQDDAKLGVVQSFKNAVEGKEDIQKVEMREKKIDAIIHIGDVENEIIKVIKEAKEIVKKQEKEKEQEKEIVKESENDKEQEKENEIEIVKNKEQIKEKEKEQVKENENVIVEENVKENEKENEKVEKKVEEKKKEKEKEGEEKNPHISVKLEKIIQENNHSFDLLSKLAVESSSTETSSMERSFAVKTPPLQEKLIYILPSSLPLKNDGMEEQTFQDTQEYLEEEGEENRETPINSIFIDDNGKVGGQGNETISEKKGDISMNITQIQSDIKDLSVMEHNQSKNIEVFSLTSNVKKGKVFESSREEQMVNNENVVVPEYRFVNESKGFAAEKLLILESSQSDETKREQSILEIEILPETTEINPEYEPSVSVIDQRLDAHHFKENFDSKEYEVIISPPSVSQLNENIPFEKMNDIKDRYDYYDDDFHDDTVEHDENNSFNKKEKHHLFFEDLLSEEKQDYDDNFEDDDKESLTQFSSVNSQDVKSKNKKQSKKDSKKRKTEENLVLENLSAPELAKKLEKVIPPELLTKLGNEDIRKTITKQILADGLSSKAEASSLKTLKDIKGKSSVSEEKKIVEELCIYPVLNLLNAVSSNFVASENSAPQRIILDKGKHAIGRNKKNAFCFDSVLYPKMVSSQHAVIITSVDAKGYWKVSIEDLKSTNGTYVNDIAIKTLSYLCNDDIIIFGTTDKNDNSKTRLSDIVYKVNIPKHSVPNGFRVQNALMLRENGVKIVEESVTKLDKGTLLDAKFMIETLINDKNKNEVNDDQEANSSKRLNLENVKLLDEAQNLLNNNSLSMKSLSNANKIGKTTKKKKNNNMNALVASSKISQMNENILDKIKVTISKPNEGDKKKSTSGIEFDLDANNIEMNKTLKKKNENLQSLSSSQEYKNDKATKSLEMQHLDSVKLSKKINAEIKTNEVMLEFNYNHRNNNNSISESNPAPMNGNVNKYKNMNSDKYETNSIKDHSDDDGVVTDDEIITEKDVVIHQYFKQEIVNDYVEDKDEIIDEYLDEEDGESLFESNLKKRQIASIDTHIPDMKFLKRKSLKLHDGGLIKDYEKEDVYETYNTNNNYTTDSTFKINEDKKKYENLVENEVNQRKTKIVLERVIKKKK